MRKYLSLIFIVITSTFVGAQNLNLRKIIQKSDLIIAIRDYQSEVIWVNDVTYKTYIKVDKTDSTNIFIFRNKIAAVPPKLILRKYTDNEDFYSDLAITKSACALNAYDPGKSYYNLFFIKKEKDEYRILMHLPMLEWEQRENYRHQIETICGVENIKKLKDRFAKTLDWFMENGLTPDSDFIEYYKSKKIITDTIQYSEKQYEKALQQFHNGKEDILPIVRKKYFDQVKQYYIQKMENILKIDQPEFQDYYAFDKAFYAIIGNRLDYESIDYVLYGYLTADKFDKYDKKIIMEHLLKLVKESI
ncbi:hypothetical protein SAMN05421780_10574 [Flexibacter flexilis DSM 6793]|uniref:Uncharacterized protein n=1 Tax=Flexibacter flexilis DSM 6793 TaxID=927664 RepID=A0A1I1IS29_9BACT|nr:hypothetical protein [Flexibacter flexilis]SFC39069.1 hypothetical protein SAMN05421780_10574 [Flexibacter flexilis DSM 6793]